jgi:GDP/UDP-N,N'-diacetylbacillosamine 2-epimerase (hydrolysing)
MKKRVCVVTGTRAEYGLLKGVLHLLHESNVLSPQLVATGMHLSPEFGSTIQEIQSDGFPIDRKVEMLLSSDSSVGISKSMGLGLIGFADAFAELQPDLVLVLGDRFEILSAASAALVARIPMAHIHGGETTEGAVDESLRHAITKMSHLHFVAAEEYRRRVIQLGEKPETVFLVGGLGVDAIYNVDLMNRKSLEKSLGFHFLEKNLLIAFHPVTLEEGSSEIQISELLDALSELKDTRLIFTMPNSDMDGRVIFSKINRFVEKNSNALAFTSMGQQRFLSCMAQVDAIVGNSSSGLLEAPSFKIATINIGDRQKGRIRAESVMDCEPKKNPIGLALSKVYSLEMKSKLEMSRNPYGEEGASKKIVSILEKTDFKKVIKKKFFDLPLNTNIEL